MSRQAADGATRIPDVRRRQKTRFMIWSEGVPDA
jgi:hypothetical protein